MPYIFQKLFEGAFTAVNNSFGFKKLTVSPSIGSILGLTPGTYTLTIRATSGGLEESDESEPVILVVG